TTPTTEPTTPTTQPTTPTTQPTTPTTQPTTPTTQPTTPTTPPSGGISVTYTIPGKTLIKGLNATLPLGPGTLKAKLDAQSGKFDAQLSLPKSKLSFRLLGLLPATADVRLDPVSDVSGTLQSGAVKASSKIDVQLSDLRIFGLPVPVSHACHTAKPAQVDLASAPGFDPLKGGKLTGKYTLPSFADCGLFTPLISGLASGPGNTIEVNLARK
ncbi:5'-nucleotidase, partial [Amycolatopsis sp. H20-H5]|nr:5'-nucleotidase [Amycolatopsis sp. H20-H5]